MTNSTDSGERSIASVLLSVIRNIEHIVKAEFRLARTEMTVEVGKAGQAAKLLGLGLVLAVLATAFMLLTFVYLLATVMEIWLAALIVTASLSIVAGVIIAVGIKKMKLIQTTPDKAIASVKENITWAKAQTR